MLALHMTANRLTRPRLTAEPGLLIGALLVFLLSLFARVSYAGGDPALSLLVSQAILEHGSIALDPYLATRPDLEDNYRVHEENGHHYYYFPLGTSLFAVPFVGIANALGRDMADPADEAQTQRVLAALSTALAFALVYLIGRVHLGATASAIIAGISVLGSSLISTLGTALWSHNFAVIFTLAALYLIVRYDHDVTRRPNPYALGALLFAAYLCRPTAIVFIVCVLAYLLLRDRALFLRTLLTCLILLGGYLAFNYAALGQPFPDYYSAARLAPAASSLGTVVTGLLVSPSRGLLVFSPFFALALVGAVVYARRLREARLVWFCVAWAALHFGLVAASGTVPWWGGHSYGSRLLTDSLPALALLTVLVWGVARGAASPPARNATMVAYLLLGGVAILINSIQGLYNGNTSRWNGQLLSPDPSAYPAYLFDWRTPQFLATKGSLCARHGGFMAPQLAQQAGQMDPYTWGTPVTYAAPEAQAFFVGWSPPQTGWRWSECNHPAVYLRLGEVDRSRSYALEVDIASRTPQDVTLQLNGTAVGTVSLVESEAITSHHRFTVDGATLKPNEINVLSFDIARMDAPIGDPHTLGITFSQLLIEPQDAPAR